MALSLNLELQGDQSAEAGQLGRGLVGLSRSLLILKPCVFFHSYCEHPQPVSVLFSSAQT